MPPQELAERALTASTADGCVVIVDELSSVNLRWANNTLTSNGRARSRMLTVIATVGGQGGIAAGVLARRGHVGTSLEELMHTAEATARAGPPSEEAQPLVAGSDSSPAWSAPPNETSVRVFADVALALEAAFARARREEQLLFGYAQHTMRSTYLASSSGLRLRHDQPAGYVEINAKSSDYATSVWEGSATSDFTDVDVAALDTRLAQRLRWAQRRIDLDPGRYETLLPPPAVADLMVHMYMSASARGAHDGRSAFSGATGTRVGEQIAEASLTLRSDPAASNLECAPFVVARSSGEDASIFDNGLSLEPTRWIDEGTLTALVQTRHTAQLTGLPVTPRIDNLILESSSPRRSLSEMIENTRRGLLLTCLWYLDEVDPQTLLLTGLTRDGVYLIERGEVVGAVNNFRFNESPINLLRRVAETGVKQRTLARQWRDFFPHTSMPTLRIEDFNMSTVSQAS